MKFRKGQSGNPSGKGGFKKGVSGNPGGRSRTATELAEWARVKSTEALERVYELTRSKDERVSLAACQVLLDRGSGKPIQRSEVDLVKRNAEAMTDDELAAIAAGGSTAAPAAPTEHRHDVPQSRP